MRSGKTTKKVDQAVQDLFKKGIAYLYEGRTARVIEHAEALDVFITRMRSEHPLCEYSYSFGNHSNVWCFKIEILK